MNYFRREFLNDDPHHSFATLMMTIKRGTGDPEVGSNTASTSFQVSDCSKQISLDFSLHNHSQRINSINKINKMIEMIEEFRSKLIEEAKYQELQEIKRMELQKSDMEAIEERAYHEELRLKAAIEALEEISENSLGSETV